MNQPAGSVGGCVTLCILTVTLCILTAVFGSVPDLDADNQDTIAVVAAPRQHVEVHKVACRVPIGIMTGLPTLGQLDPCKNHITTMLHQLCQGHMVVLILKPLLDHLPHDTHTMSQRCT